MDWNLEIQKLGVANESRKFEGTLIRTEFKRLLDVGVCARGLKRQDVILGGSKGLICKGDDHA